MAEQQTLLTQTARRRLALIVCVLLLIAASRIWRISVPARDVHVDEAWQVWQTMDIPLERVGTFEQQWPGGHPILIYLWRNLVGIHPLVIRYLHTLTTLIGAVCVYQVARRLRDQNAGILAMLAYGALGIGIYMTTSARPYGTLYMLLPVAFWFMLRYFDRPSFDRITMKRAIPLALSMAALFWNSYGALGVFLGMGLYSLVVYRGKVWRWWLPGVIAAVAAIPAIQDGLGMVQLRASAARGEIALVLDPFPKALYETYRGGFGDSILIWLALIVLATLLIFGQKRPVRSKTLGLIVWAALPVALYILYPFLGLMGALYGWFIYLGILLWIAIGLSYLPRPGQWIAGGVLLGILFAPLRYSLFQAEPPPLGRSFEWLSQNVLAGDVLTIDPKWRDDYCQCAMFETFDYLTRVYMPQGVQLVQNPEGYRRVWYLKQVGKEDPAFEARVKAGRLEEEFVGPPDALFRLYEGPPDPVGVPFENGMRFHGVEIINRPNAFATFRAGDTMRLRLWWSADKQVAFDYSVGIQVPFNGQTAIQSDSAPQIVQPDSPKETSRWQMGRFYVEERDVVVHSLPSGDFPIYMTVYQWWDLMRVPASSTNDDRLLRIATLHMRVW